MQTIVAILLDEPTTMELVDTTRECAKKMDKDLEGLKANFKKFTKKMKQIMTKHKE